MAELKTLKDIKEEVDNDAQGCVELFNDKQRQEAIKWIKKLQSDHPYEVFNMDQYIKGQIDWIKQYFNITEGDLK